MTLCHPLVVVYYGDFILPPDMDVFDFERKSKQALVAFWE